MNNESALRPHIPSRSPLSQRSIDAALILWREGECYDCATLERIAAGLRSLDLPFGGSEPRTQHEIDGVIARWKASHQRVTR